MNNCGASGGFDTLYLFLADLAALPWGPRPSLHANPPQLGVVSRRYHHARGATHPTRVPGGSAVKDM